MSRLRAATIQADDARAYLAAKLRALAVEANHQADRLRLGDDYDGRLFNARMLAVEEARDMHHACEQNVKRVLRHERSA